MTGLTGEDLDLFFANDFIITSHLIAAEIATSTGSDMVIANADDFHVIHRIIEGEHVGTIFMNHPREEFYWVDYLQNMRHGE